MDRGGQQDLQMGKISQQYVSDMWSGTDSISDQAVRYIVVQASQAASSSLIDISLEFLC